jgi:EmrB/QacA subfamily drug resistance transporter
MLLLDITIVNVALPDIQQSLTSSFADLQWVVDAYALTLASLLLTAGSLADMYGRRRLYLAGLGVFTAASVLCGAASSTLMLELSRGLQGVGGAVMFSVSLALLANAFRGRERGVAFGVWGSINGVAVAVGPVLGGALVSGFSWRAIFFVNLPIGLGAIALTLARVAESRERGVRRPDWAGFVLFTAGLGCLVFALIEAGRRTFTDPLVLGCFGAAAVLLVVFVAIEALGRHPMFDLALFRLPTFSGGAIAAFGISASLYSMLLYLVLYLQDVLGYSAFGTGLRLLVLSGCVLAVAGIAGRLTAHVPVRLLIGAGLLLTGAGLLLMRGLTASSSWTHLIAGLAVAGVGSGFVNPPLASTAVGVVAPQRAGMASGINSTFRQVGIATGIALLGTLFSNRLTSAVTDLVAGTPLAGRGEQIASALRSGEAGRLFQHARSHAEAATLQHIARGSFTTALDHILLVAAVIALVTGVAAFALIRSKDFAEHPGGGTPQQDRTTAARTST